MLFVTVFAAAAVALVSSAPNPTNVFEIDITPEEAQKYLNSPPFTDPVLSSRTAVLPLVRWNDPKFRSAEAGPTLGHYWKNGHEIENVQDYDEEVYQAAQFHGQDGLGGYAYGYSAPESSKVENRERSGDVTGSYTYKDANNGLIKVRYWADSEGFHQEDNLPKVELQPAQETEEVQQARLAHERAWQEAAAAAAQQPDPQGEYSANYEYQASASGPQAVVAPAPQDQPREGKAYSGQNYQHINQQGQAGRPSQPGQYGQQQQFGQQPQYGQQAGQQSAQFGQQSSQYGQTSSHQYGQQSQQGQYGQQSQSGQYQGSPDEAEPTGPPKGFFYSFDYPVSIIVPKNGGGQSGGVNPGYPVDSDTVSLNPQRG